MAQSTACLNESWGAANLTGLHVLREGVIPANQRYIWDGGEDMYDGGNRLFVSADGQSFDVGWQGSQGLPYTERCGYALSPSGVADIMYVTCKLGTLFAAVAWSASNAIRGFHVGGRLGADGLGVVDGNLEPLVSSSAEGLTGSSPPLLGYYKSVHSGCRHYSTSSSCAASVSHLIVTSTVGNHAWASDGGDLDDDTLLTPAGVSLIYFLAWGGPVAGYNVSAFQAVLDALATTCPWPPLPPPHPPQQPPPPSQPPSLPPLPSPSPLPGSPPSPSVMVPPAPRQPTPPQPTAATPFAWTPSGWLPLLPLQPPPTMPPHQSSAGASPAPAASGSQQTQEKSPAGAFCQSTLTVLIVIAACLAAGLGLGMSARRLQHLRWRRRLHQRHELDAAQRAQRHARQEQELLQLAPAVAALPTLTASEARAEWPRASVPEECCICLETIRDHDVLRRLPCGHAFHSACVDGWLLRRHEQPANGDDGVPRRACPMCKVDPFPTVDVGDAAQARTLPPNALAIASLAEDASVDGEVELPQVQVAARAGAPPHNDTACHRRGPSASDRGSWRFSLPLPASDFSSSPTRVPGIVSV